MMMRRINENRLRRARLFADINQMELWLKPGIQYSTISRAESGYITPTDRLKQKLALALGVKADWQFLKERGKR